MSVGGDTVGSPNPCAGVPVAASISLPTPAGLAFLSCLRSKADEPHHLVKVDASGRLGIGLDEKGLRLLEAKLKRPKREGLVYMKKHDGFISAGADFIKATMTIAKAKELASRMPGCFGFCFVGVESEERV